ncbi:hypothetical protein [Patulibacter minatonensis]|uniref:hypothetical protein n=1 Tax=Patulibacter minatonensis TaxID=298163 RepID=UPI000478B6ED|nr:hypothetical protein [Patulibacter minatonensis]
MSLFRSASARRAGGRAVPWLVVADVAREGHRHWTSRLSGRERRRLVELVRRSRGRRSRLTDREQRELRRLVAQLDLKLLARHAAQVAVVGKVRHSRRRGR